MEESELCPSKPSLPMAFPPYRRSHLRSKTYHTLLHILAHFPPSTVPTRPLNMPDNDNDRTEKENQEKEPECSKLKAGSDFMDPKSPVPQKEIDEIIEGVGDQSRDTSAVEMVLDDIELLIGREEMKQMDELDDGLIPVDSGLCEKPNSGSDVDLMDYQVEDVEFLHIDANTSGNSNELQVPEELNQLASEGFHVSTPTKGQASVSVITTSNLNQELVKSDCLAVGSSPLVEDHGFEKEEQYVQKVAEATHISFNPDTNIDALNMSGDVGLLESTILKDKNDTHNGEKLCSNTLIEEGGLEEGEISGDFEMDDNSFDVSSPDALISDQIKVDEVQKTENVFGNTVYPCKIGNGEKEEGSQSNSFMVNALQDANSNGQVEPRTSNQNGIGCGTKLAISPETIKFDKTGEYGSVLMPKFSEDRCIGTQGTSDMPTCLIPNQALHRGFLEVATTKDHGDSFALQQMVGGGRKKRSRCGSRKNKNKNEQENDAIASGKRKCVSDSEEKEDKNKMVDASRSKKRGPGSEEKKDKKKRKYRQKRAEKNRELGIKRLTLPLPVQKPKTIRYCRHYLKGRCHEGDKCKFSHDTVPLTKTTTPCHHFARQSCMKGDDCPFDHELSKYPCNKFVSTGSCNRGGSCMFSHQAPTNQGIFTPTNPNVCKPELKSTPTNPNVCKPELKSPPLSGNTNFSKPLNNHGGNSLQQNHFTNSKGSYSHINAEHKFTDTPQVQPTPAPKGIKLINFPPSTPKQNMVTPNKENIVQSGTRGDQSASGTTQNIAEIPKKLPAGTPKRINFLSFGKGPICSTRSFISSYLNKESNLKLPRLINSGLPGQASLSLSKDDYSQVSDRAKQSLPQTALFSQEILDKNQSMAEGMKSRFTGKASIDDCKLVQDGEKASDNSQTPSVDSAILLPRPFVSHQSSECLMSGYLKQASASSHRALLSTLAFAAELESDIKMKCTFASPPDRILDYSGSISSGYWRGQRPLRPEYEACGEFVYRFLC